MNLSPGDVLALRYKVKRRIGGGSFGEIYLGKKNKLRYQKITLKM
jgi:serine/threonine protein kinase